MRSCCCKAARMRKAVEGWSPLSAARYFSDTGSRALAMPSYSWAMRSTTWMPDDLVFMGGMIAHFSRYEKHSVLRNHPRLFKVVCHQGTHVSEESNMNSVVSDTTIPSAPDFCAGIQYYGAPWPDFARHAREAVIAEGKQAMRDADDAQAVYQTLLGADALRYLTLQMCGAKASGHPGGFASSAEAYAALVMLGHTNIVTEVGHHAPGFYSAMFLDTSLEEMGIKTVQELRDRFRERHGLLGHLSGAIPGILAPAGPLGQGQHFAMAGALLHPGTLFPFTLGDGGMGEPYVLSAMMHFNTAYPRATNFLPVLIWNGYSQEHHSMVSTMSDEAMIAYWRGHGFKEVILVDAKQFDDSGQQGPYVDSSRFSLPQRLAFTAAVLKGMDRAAHSALGGTLTCFIVKQLKGTGVHTLGSKSHNLYPADTLDKPHIIEGLQRRALPPQAWAIVRENFRRAGGGPAVKTSVTERVLELVPLGRLPTTEYVVGDKAVPSTAMGALVAEVGKRDARFVVTNADGNEASGMKNINEALKIRHPTNADLYHQSAAGQVYEPLNEDACAGSRRGARAVRFACVVAVVRELRNQRLAHHPERDAGHGRVAPQDAVHRMHVHRRRARAGTQRLDPSAPRDRKLFRGHDAQWQCLSAVSLRCEHDPGRVRMGHQQLQ